MFRLLFLLLFLATGASLNAQLDTIHWLPPMHARSDQPEQFLYLSTPETIPFTVTLEDGAGRIFRTVTISNALPRRVDIATGVPSRVVIDNARLNLVLFDRGLVIHGPKPFYANFRANSGDRDHACSLTCKGRIATGTEFRAGHLLSTYGNDRCHFIGMMATEDNTTIVVSNLRPRLTLAGPRNGIVNGSVTINLGKGQAYVMSTYSEPNRPENDEGFLGTLIESNKPIVVNVGSWKGSPQSGSRDIGIDQIVPIESVGTEYIVIRGNGTDNIERPIIVAAYDNTEISVNFGTNFNLDAGNYRALPATDFSPDSNMYIKASRPVYLYQHLGGLPRFWTSGLNFIPPLSCLIPKKADNIPYFREIGDRVYSGHVLIVAQKGFPVSINGNELLAADAKPVPCNPDFVTYKIPESQIPGFHAGVTSEGSIQVALLGGDQNAGWAGYFSGFPRKPQVDLNTGIAVKECPDTLFASGIYDEIEWWRDGVKLDSVTGTVLPDPLPGIYQIIGYFSNCKNVQDTSSVFVISLKDTVNLLSTTCNPLDSGVFVNHYRNQDGCDSTVVNKVSLLESHRFVIDEFSCNPLDTGTFVQNLTNRFGCDSTLVLKTSLSPTHRFEIFESSCNPLDTGIFTKNMTNQFGCDSVEIRTVRWLPFSETELFQNSCNPADTGIFVRVLKNDFGCDSIVTTKVELLPASNFEIQQASCNPLDTGTFVQNLTNQFGCDSTVVLKVSLLPDSQKEIFSGSCQVRDTGVFVQNLTNHFGCDSLVTTHVQLLPSHSVELFGGSCFPRDTGVFVRVFTNQFGCDSTVSTKISLLEKSETRLFSNTCNPLDTGTFVQNLMNRNQCDSTVTTVVSLLPSHQISLNRTTCNPARAGLFTDRLTNQFGCDSLVTTQIDFVPLDSIFLPPVTTCKNLPFEKWGEIFVNDGTYCRTFQTAEGCDSTLCFDLAFRDTSITRQSLQVCEGDSVRVGNSVYKTSGIYSDIFQKENSCDSLVITDLSVFKNPAPAIEGEQIYCLGDTVEINLVGNYDRWVWTPGGETSSSIFRTTAATVGVNVWDENGCAGVAQFNLPPPIEVSGEIAIETDYNGYPVRCHDSNDAALSAWVAGGLAPLVYAWSNGANKDNLQNMAPGNYFLTVTDAADCQWLDSVFLNAPPPLQFDLLSTPARCFGEKTGTIEIAEVGGGVAGYRFGWEKSDTASFENILNFENLAAGNYRLWALDANGCLAYADIRVNEPAPLSINLGPDLELDLGDSVRLNPRIVGIFEQIEWSPADFLNCSDCLRPFSRPLQNIEYKAVIQDQNGCLAEDDILLRVNYDYSVYIPSAFSPNADGANDFFTVYTSANVEEVETFQVYSRWGELVFENYHFQPNIETLGWDGNYRGKPMQPAVFAYYAVVRFIDGKKKLYKGDVSLIK